MKISGMTEFVSRAPWPCVVALDRLGEKDPELKRRVVAIDRALVMDYSERVIKTLLEELFQYIEVKYLTRKPRLESRVVMFIADARKKKSA